MAGSEKKIVGGVRIHLLGSIFWQYLAAMRVAIDLTELQADRLRDEAARLGVAPEELARAAVADLLTAQREDFREAAEHVLRKNEELYRRLA